MLYKLLENHIIKFLIRKKFSIYTKILKSISKFFEKSQKYKS